jgi:hypothetical protein
LEFTTSSTSEPYIHVIGVLYMAVAEARELAPTYHGKEKKIQSEYNQITVGGVARLKIFPREI